MDYPPPNHPYDVVDELENKASTAPVGKQVMLAARAEILKLRAALAQLQLNAGVDQAVADLKQLGAHASQNGMTQNPVEPLESIQLAIANQRARLSVSIRERMHEKQPVARTPREVAPSTDSALSELNNCAQHAYSTGYPELGYDPLSVLRDALSTRIESGLSMSECSAPVTDSLVLLFRQLPLGTRFSFIEEFESADVWVVLDRLGNGRIARWEGVVGPVFGQSCFWAKETPEECEYLKVLVQNGG
jgi:hypothetical protein